MGGFTVPDWVRAQRNELTTARPFGSETLLLPVAGKRTDGAPDYSRLFARDSFKAVFLEKDPVLARDVLVYFASRQGRKPDPFTAEEPGKIAHEIPGVTLRRRNTLFSACDTTQDFLILCARYLMQDDADPEVWPHLVPRMAAALGYIRAHSEEGLFLEDPRHSGATCFALLATYWRDYGIPGRRGRRLNYPVAYLLVQAQTVAALRAMLELTVSGRYPGERRRLEGELRAAQEAFRRHFDRRTQPVAIDARGEVQFLATDAAHALWYLEPDDVGEQYVARSLEQLAALETPWGWRTYRLDRTIPGMAHQPGAGKDFERIWPWEHPFVVDGAARHGATGLRVVAMRMAEYLASTKVPFTEFVELRRGQPQPAGCHTQLWTLGFWSWVERELLKQMAAAS